MPIYERGGAFQVSVGSGAARKRETTSTRAEAEALELALLAELRDEKLRRVAARAQGDPAKTVGHAVEAAIRDHWLDTKSRRTTELNVRDIAAILGWDRPLVSLMTSDVDDAVAELIERGITGSTINRKLSALSVSLRNARRKGWVKDLPDILRRKESECRIGWYTEETEKLMLDTCERLGLNALANFITVGIDTGFRRTEMLRLVPADLAGGLVILHAGETKSGKARAVPATESVVAVFEAAKGVGSPRVFQSLTDSILRSQWSQLREALHREQDPFFIVHTLRHTTATRLAFAGATAPQIMAFMGHSSLQVSQKYIHLAAEHVKGIEVLLTRKAPRVVSAPLPTPLPVPAQPAAGDPTEAPCDTKPATNPLFRQSFSISGPSQYRVTNQQFSGFSLGNLGGPWQKT
ncbi:MAG: tyrosine-type recombinase/integrase [Proteobacteria bacterium]|nr:tyrosine-type recombinase/integrase [Pseudomonadota bacterium]